MKRPPPSFEPRGRAELKAELLARARSWIPEWQPDDPAADPGMALLRIAARIESEVTRRLAQVPQKSYRGLLAWLGVRGRPGSAARVPVAFRLNPNAAPLDVATPVQMRATALDESVMLEVRDVLNLRASSIVTMIAADETRDRWFRAPPGLFSLEPPAAVPGRWNLRANASAQSTRLQLDPPQGLASGDVLVDEKGNEYEVAAAKDGLVSVAPPVRAGGLRHDAVLTRASVFRPFDAGATDQQKHELYFGADRLFDVKDSVVFEVTADGALPPDATWDFWGLPPEDVKGEPEPKPGWRAMSPVTCGGRLFLLKPGGEIVQHEFWGKSTRWIRARFDVDASGKRRQADALRLRIVLAGAPADDKANGIEKDCKEIADWIAGQRAKPGPQKDGKSHAGIEWQGIAGTAPLVMGSPFYPLGVEPRLFDAFYLGSNEAFSKPGATVTCHFALGDQLESPSAALDDDAVAAIGIDGRLHVMLGLKVAAPSTLRTFSTQPKGEDGRPVSLDTSVRPGVLKVNDAA